MGAAVGAASGFMAGCALTAMTAGATALGSWGGLGGALISPMEGALITGTEFAIGGFAAGLASGYAGGEGSVGDMFAQAGIGAAMGFGTGFAVGYSYTAGWQNVLHGADTQAANARTIEAQQRRLANITRTLDEAQKQNSLLGRMKAEREIAGSAGIGRKWGPDWLEKIVPPYGAYGAPGHGDALFRLIPRDQMDSYFMTHDMRWTLDMIPYAEREVLHSLNTMPRDPRDWNPPSRNPYWSSLYRGGAQVWFTLTDWFWTAIGK